MRGIEAHECEFAAVVGCGVAPAATDLLLPFTSDGSGFVDVSVEGDEGLALFNETLDRDASDMHIQRSVVDHLAVECGAVEFRLVRG
mgnify:CR=1 FL=1